MNLERFKSGSISKKAGVVAMPGGLVNLILGFHVPAASIARSIETQFPSTNFTDFAL